MLYIILIYLKVSFLIVRKKSYFNNEVIFLIFMVIFNILYLIGYKSKSVIKMLIFWINVK